MDLKTVKYLLNDWAQWHVRTGGSIRSSLATALETPVQSGRPASRPPTGVEIPSQVQAIITAMGAIETLDSNHAKAIGAVRSVYLRSHNAKLAEVAQALGIAEATLDSRRRLGETAILCFLVARGRRYR